MEFHLSALSVRPMSTSIVLPLYLVMVSMLGLLSSTLTMLVSSTSSRSSAEKALGLVNDRRVLAVQPLSMSLNVPNSLLGRSTYATLLPVSVNSPSDMAVIFRRVL